jgi:exodeoxyribonuclease-3
VLAGDYNVVPNYFDINNPRSWRKDALLQPESRECYARLLKQGWTDALRVRFPDEQVFTFWDYFRQAFEHNRGIRIDHFLLSPAAAQRLQSCEIDKNPRTQPKPSDHTPIVLVLS